MLQSRPATACAGFSAISEFLAETPPAAARADGRFAVPGHRAERAEIRRLIDWFNGKFNREVTQQLLQEKVYTRLQPAPTPRRTRTSCAPSANLRYHMSYVNYLAHQRPGSRARSCRLPTSPRPRIYP